MKARTAGSLLVLLLSCGGCAVLESVNSGFLPGTEPAASESAFVDKGQAQLAEPETWIRILDAPMAVKSVDGETTSPLYAKVTLSPGAHELLGVHCVHERPLVVQRSLVLIGRRCNCASFRFTAASGRTYRFRGKSCDSAVLVDAATEETVAHPHACVTTQSPTDCGAS